ncbi:MAG TPA: phosphoglycerate dehydrogenase [Phycisphaerae bacterium]|nr:phosphoglycerate dehydrogenase [Phycisphaerae bacterium]
MKILVSDKLADEGIAILRAEPGFEVDVKTDLKPDELKAIIGQYDGICIRSATKLTADILAKPGNLKAIARAGVGVDNVDLPTATRHGIVVVNAPDGNTLSTAELTVTLMLALSRNIAPACASLKAGQWDRKAFMGRQLAGKTVGIVGLGRIGSAVAKRCLAFDMKVVGYDPFIAGAPPDLAKEIRLVDNLDDLVKVANYLTVHTPMTDETRGIVGKRQLEMMPKGAYVINAARGGIVDENALLEVLKTGHLGGAALDVYPQEPAENRALVEHPLVLCLPHLGASTKEAQQSVAIDACHNLVDYLAGRELRNAVNVPAIDFAAVGALKPYAELGHRMGVILAAMMHGRLKRLVITYAGDVAKEPFKPVTVSTVMGLLQRVSSSPLNMVNAIVVAKEEGLDISETTQAEARGYISCLRVSAEGDKESHSVQGTVFHQRYPRIIALDDFYMELKPEGDLVITFNEDRPGVIGDVGSTFGQLGINIASMTFGRKVDTQEACLALTLDAVPPPNLLEELRGKAFMKRVHYVSLPPLVSESA